MATNVQFYWPSAGNSVAAYGQLLMSADTRSTAAARGSDHENLPGPRCPRDRLTLDSQNVATRYRPAKSANKTRGEAVNPVRS